MVETKSFGALSVGSSHPILTTTGYGFKDRNRENKTMSVFDTIRQNVAANQNNTVADSDADVTVEVEVDEFNEDYWQIIDGKRALWKVLGSLDLLADNGRKTDTNNPVCVLHSELYKKGEAMSKSDDKPDTGLRAYREGRAVPEWAVEYRLSRDNPDEILDVIAEFTDVPRDALFPIDWNDEEDDIFLSEEAFELLLDAIDAALEMPAVDPSEIAPEHVATILATIGAADGVGEKTLENIKTALSETGFDF